MLTRLLVATLLGISLALPAHAATYYVATTGNDTTGNGSEGNPWRTIQKAANTVVAGDTVNVAAGRYQERVLIQTSGTSGSARITYIGATGAIIDGGTTVTGWSTAPEIGTGVYKKTWGQSWTPANMSWNDKHVLKIHDSYMGTGTGNALLSGPSSTAVVWWGYLNGVVYVGHKDDLDPNTATLKFAPANGPADIAAVRIKNASFVTIRGFEIRNAYRGVRIDGTSNDNIIEFNAIYGGSNTVEIASGGPTDTARNIIRSNTISSDYINPDIWGVQYKNLTTQEGYKDVKNRSGGGDNINAIRLTDTGPDNEIYQNTITKHFVGISHSTRFSVYGGTVPSNRATIDDYNQGLKIYSNTLSYLNTGIEAVDGGVNVEWHDNLVEECTECFRVKCLTTGPMYMYRNRVSNYTLAAGAGLDVAAGTLLGKALSITINMDPNTPGVFYVYHNTFATEQSTINFVTTSDQPSTFGLANFWFLNNIFSSYYAHLKSSPSATHWPNGVKSHIDYNWLGGVASNINWSTTQHNVLRPDESLWTPRSSVNYQLVVGSTALEIGVNLATTWVVDGQSKAALPGMATGYFDGDAPDAGAVQLQVYDPPGGGGANTLLDAFTNTDGTALGTHTALWLTSQPMEISSNQVRRTATGSQSGVAFWQQAYVANQDVSIKVGTRGADGEWLSLFCRMSNTSMTATQSGYFVTWEFIAGASNDTLKFYRMDNGVAVQLGATVISELADGNIPKLSCQGTTIEALVGGVSAASRTDATYSASGFIGFETKGTTQLLDDFSVTGTIPVPLVFRPAGLSRSPAPARPAVPARSAAPARLPYP